MSLKTACDQSVTIYVNKKYYANQKYCVHYSLPHYQNKAKRNSDIVIHHVSFS